jgi:hypothetical protein
VIVKRRLNDIQQRLVLDQSILNLFGPEQKLQFYNSEF